MKLHAYCHASLCFHNQSIDLQVLKAKLGPDAPAMADDLVPKLRCAKCGSKKVGLIYAPDPKQVSGMGRRPLSEVEGHLSLVVWPRRNVR